ncbi:unnamed protein product [Caenorhabditis nigoni]
MSSFRIPKKPRQEESAGGSSGGSSGPNRPPGGPSGVPPGGSRPPPGGSYPPVRFTTPGSSSSNGKSFQPLSTIPVQTNIFSVSIGKTSRKFVRLSMETILCGGKTEVKLSDGIQAVSGGLNISEKRLAIRQIFRKVFERHPELFGNNFLHYTFDCATTIYAVDGAYKGGEKKLEETLQQSDFTEEEWKTISRILRRQKTFFKIILSANGVVYADGPNAMSDKNKQELVRVVETVTSEALNTNTYLQYGSQTFPMREQPMMKPDATSEIRFGFDKAVRLAEGTDGVPEIVMSIDTKQSPFVAATSVMKFMCSKFSEAKGRVAPGASGAQRGRGGYGGDRRGGHHRQDSRDQRRRSRSRSPIERSSLDYNEGEVQEMQDAFQRGNEEKVFGKIQDWLKGFFLEPSHLPKDKNRNITVMKLTPGDAKTTKFELNVGEGQTKQVSVADYFLEHHHYKIKFPHLPLVVSGRLRNLSFTPIELLTIVPGQRIKIQKMSATVQSSMTGQNATLPREHTRRIMDILKFHLKIEGNRHLAAFGVNVAMEPIQMQAMILAPAQMTFGGSTVVFPPPGSVQFRPRNGARFWRPARVNNVAVIGFDGVRIDLDHFCNRLHSTCQRNGLDMRNRPQEWIKLQMNFSDTARLKGEMAQLLREQVSIVIGITSEKKPDVHDVMKYYEAGIGLQTLQIHDRTAECFMREQGGAQTVDNVMRKLNLKLGGINFMVDPVNMYEHKVICNNIGGMKKKLFEKVQFVGFEMTHGSSRTLYDKAQGQFDGEPTIVGCGYSLSSPTELGGYNFLQERNEYKLKNLDSHFKTCLDQYKEATKSLPETVVIFRTGAGEGDFKRVQEEVEEMQGVCRKIGGSRAPKLVVVVVQKSSHTRIFPKEIMGHKAYEQNVKSGTMIDTRITNAGREEFILVSQSALIGTVRPVKYSIVANTPEWSKNEVANLAYILAFGHQVSYQPPAVPHVLYAAENLAKRGRNNYLQHKKLGELSKSIKKVLDEHRDLLDAEEGQLDAVLVDNITASMNKMAVMNKNFWA